MDKRAFVLPLAFSLGLVPAGLAAGSGQERPASQPRHEVVVTATRLETPEKKVGSSVTVLTAEDLARSRKTFVLEALAEVPGLSVLQNGGPGAAASVMIRGAGSEHTLILLDGLELNDPINPSRSFDLAHLSLSRVERVEILRGPQGLLYGSDALGGVVNIITKSGRGRPRLDLSASAASMRTMTADAAVSGSGRKADFSVALFEERTAGLSAASSAYPGNREKDGYRNWSLAARCGLAAGPRSHLTLALRAVTARTELDNFGGSGGDDPNSRQDYGSLLVRAQYRSHSPAGRWERSLSLSWTGARRENRNPVDEIHPQDSDRGLYTSDLFKLDWQNNIRLRASHTLIAGLEAERERGRSEYFSESAWGVFESAFPSAQAGTLGLYLLDHWDYRDRLFVTAGVRVDRHSRAGSAVTYRLAPAYRLAATGTKFKASLGSGFKSPSLYQLFAPATSWGAVGNIGLKPERVVGADIGFEQNFWNDRLVVCLTGFMNTFRDLIDFDVQAGYLNIGRARTRGFEASAEARPAEGLRLKAAYTRLSALDVDAGTELLRRPRDKFSGDVSAQLLRRWSLAVSVLWVGRRLDRDYSLVPSPTVPLRACVVLGAALSASLGPRLELFARVDNALNTRYEQVLGYGTPGISLRTGFNLAL